MAEARSRFTLLLGTPTHAHDDDFGGPRARGAARASRRRELRLGAAARSRFSESAEAKLSLVRVEGTDGSSLPVERSVAATSSSAAFRETLAHVVLGAVEGLAAETVVKAAMKAPPAPAPESSRDAGPAPRGGVHVMLAARGGPLQVARNRVTAAFGGGIGIHFDTTLGPSSSLDAALPTRVARGGVDASLNLVSLRAVPRVRAFDSRLFGLEAGVSVGLDVVKFSSSTMDVGTVPTDATRRVQPMLGPCASGLIHASSGIDVVLASGLDIDLAPRRWVVARGPAERPLFELSRARPYAYLGLVWNMPSGERRAETSP